MPTYNRPGQRCLFVVEEAIESFLMQTYPDKELIVLNDTPGQRLEFNHPEVKIINLDERCPDLSDKIIKMIEVSTGQILRRWDDDDINLPFALQFSQRKLGENLEWRPGNYWYDPGHLEFVKHSPANVH